jgi:Leu/Phe-tRNA-protein transferase
MTTNQDVLSKYKSGIFPIIREGFMYKKATWLFVNPLRGTVCLENTFRKFTGVIRLARSRKWFAVAC